MSKKIKNSIAIGLPILIFVISGILYYCSVLNAEKSFVEISSLPNSKKELENGNYNLYSLNLDTNTQKDLKVKAVENKTHDTLNISISKKKDSFGLRKPL